MILIAPIHTNEVHEYEIYSYEGHGVQESPYYNIKVIMTITCNSLDAFIISQAKNIELHGATHTQSSWESPKFSYRLKK